MLQEIEQNLAAQSTIKDRKVRSLVRWLSQVTGVNACWIEGIDSDENLLWGIAKKTSRKSFLIRSRKLLVSGALTTALIVGSTTLSKAQITTLSMDKADGESYGFLFEGTDSGAEIGTTIAIGDINGDGFDDVLAGGYGYDFPGSAFVLFGDENGFSSTVSGSSLNGSNGFKIVGANDYDYLGEGVAISDINGDGFGDMAITAKGDQKIYVIFGKSTSFSSTVGVSSLNGTNGFTLNTTSTSQGTILSSGDINGDDIDDLLISPDANQGYVLFGSDEGFSSSMNLNDLDGTDGFKFTSSDFAIPNPISSGDVNGDSFDDLIVGSPFADPTSSNEGVAYVMFGKKDSFSASFDLNTLNGTTGFKVIGQNSGDNFGSSVLAADINGDGFDEVVFGAENFDPDGDSNAGSMFVLFGKNTAFSSSFNASTISGSTGFRVDEFRATSSATAAGDLNGDGYEDILLTDGVGAYIVFGKNSSFSDTFDLSDLSVDEGLYVSRRSDSSPSADDAIASGDFNNDGLDDLAFGSTGLDISGKTNVGGFHVFFNKKIITIPGAEGFHMLGSPKSGTVLDDFLNDTWTQGITGGDVSHGSPNLWVWDETKGIDGDWTPMTNINTQSLVAGKGYLAYLFSDSNGPDIAGDAGFPQKIGVLPFGGEGIANEGTIVVTTDLGDGRFLLASNPYGETIDWDASSGWLKTNISNTIYIWDSATSDWKEWNGFFGDLGDGVLAPYQGFFIQANGGIGQLAMTEDVIGGSATLLKEKSESIPKALILELTTEKKSSQAFISFQENASRGFDNLDALELQSLSDSFLRFGSLGDAKEVLSINALPNDIEGQIRLPIHISGQNISQTALLNISGLDKFNSDWKFELLDHQTGSSIDLTLNQEVQVEIKVSETSAKSKSSYFPPPTPIKLKSVEISRYELIITTETSVGNEVQKEIPAKIELNQNYPNPFNPTTIINYGVPESSLVTLEIFNLLGQKVATLLHNEMKQAGRHDIKFDANDLSSGIYIYRLVVSGTTLTKKLTLIK